MEPTQPQGAQQNAQVELEEPTADQTTTTHQVAAVPPLQPGERERLLTTQVLRAQLRRLAQKSIPAKQAAEMVGCHFQTARAHYADPDFRKEVMDEVAKAFGEIDNLYVTKRKNLHEMLEEQAYRSFEDLMSMLEESDLHPALRVKINQDFLNRSGEAAAYAPKASNMTAKDLQLAASAAREMDNVLPFKKTG